MEAGGSFSFPNVPGFTEMREDNLFPGYPIGRNTILFQVLRLGENFRSQIYSLKVIKKIISGILQIIHAVTH